LPWPFPSGRWQAKYNRHSGNGSRLGPAVVPFDQYQGEGLKPATKSLAFSLTFQAFDRTLQEEEVMFSKHAL
jgi:phenylalanyl-tRNA synthetase beta subunit